MRILQKWKLFCTLDRQTDNLIAKTSGAEAEKIEMTTTCDKINSCNIQVLIKCCLDALCFHSKDTISQGLRSRAGRRLRDNYCQRMLA